LSVLGKTSVYMGPSGSGTTMKLCANTLLGLGMQALAEAVTLGLKAGLQRERLLDVLGGTAVVSPSQKSKLENARKDEYPATFPLRLMFKDFSLVAQRASSFSVLGDVKLANRFPALPSGERILDAIARAGGLASPGNESWVVFERDKRRVLIPFGAIVDVPENNIFVRPNDIIYAYREPQTFLAFGASGRQAQIPFEAWRVSLAEAVAKANGLTDLQADPGAVFLYRGEPREVAVELGVDVSRFDGPIIPVIYNLDLRDPAGYFLASKFEIRNKDVIYAANASSVEVTKFLSYVRLIIGTINDPIYTAVNIYTLKGLIQGTGTANVLVGATGGK